MKTPLSDKEVHAALQKVCRTYASKPMRIFNFPFNFLQLNDRVFDLKFDEPVIRRFLKCMLGLLEFVNRASKQF